MILVTGSVQGNAATIDELTAISLDHVRRSRAEPGCIAHDVHFHVEDGNRLVFVEQWADMAALKAHIIGSGMIVGLVIGLLSLGQFS